MRAFRRAARSLAALEPDQLEALAAAGRLREVPGVGDTTARVIEEALAGGQPGVPASSSSTTPRWRRAPTVQQLRDLLQGDCHSHSDWSDGGSPIARWPGRPRPWVTPTWP